MDAKFWQHLLDHGIVAKRDITREGGVDVATAWVIIDIRRFQQECDMIDRLVAETGGANNA